MSIEIYCSRFLQGQKVPIPESPLVEAFGAAAATPQTQWQEGITASASSGALAESLTIHRPVGDAWSLTVSRPSADIRLYLALLSLLGLEGVVVYAPDSPPVVGCSSTSLHLPHDMLARLGDPQLVTTPAALMTSLFGSGPQGAG